MELESDEEFYEQEEVESHELNNENKNSNENLFCPLIEKDLIKIENPHISKLYSETKNINSYLMESLSIFQKIFINNNSSSFSDFLIYLEKRSIPNNCICAGIIEKLPGWRCVDCSLCEDTLYCNECYKMSKDLHKGHTFLFLNSTTGMCDCGDPGSFKQFCSKHTGPLKNIEEIQNIIQKSFSEDEINNLKIFFDEFFYKFSRYFFLFEDLELFYNHHLSGIIPTKKEHNYIKNDIVFLKKQFCIVFQNFLNFIRLISKKNTGLFLLLTNYFLKNNLYINSIEKRESDEFMTTHKCYKIEKDEIKTLNTKDKFHKCECPFMRLFLSNYREEIKLDDNENDQFLLTFNNNLDLKKCFCISSFILYEQILLNNNDDIINDLTQFYTNDAMNFILTKTTLLEESYDISYNYYKKVLKSIDFEDDEINAFKDKIKFLNLITQIIEDNIRQFSKIKSKEIQSKKLYIFKKLIDIISLVHNQLEFKSIFPHPFFKEDKSFSKEFIILENNLINIVEDININYNWNDLEKSEELFKYIINKIINQEKEGVKQLKEDEFSFHICLYRCFGLLINYFCFNYAINNNSDLIEAINIVKNYFGSEENKEIFLEKIIKDYLKLFGFIGGIKNNYFKYYGNMNKYFYYYINEYNFIKIDFCTMKYLLLLNDKKFDLIHYLKLSNIENIFPVFSYFFSNENLNKNKSVCYNEVFKYEYDKTNFIMQIYYLFELMMQLMKDDSCIYYCLISQYKEILSSQIKKELFNILKENKDIYMDLKIILIEKIICIMVSNGNLVDLTMLKNEIDSNLIYIFKENNIFEKILDELTDSKMKGKEKIFYLKDKYLKYIDFNYFLNPIDKSKAEKYIQDFKKDEIKLYNKHFNNFSKITFYFVENVYGKILLHLDNIKLLKKIIEVLNEGNSSKLGIFDKKSFMNSILPVILNYLSNFSNINTKEFICFKIKNKEIIEKIKQLFFDILDKNEKDKNKLILTNFEENIKTLISELDYYKIIYDEIKGDLSKLNDNDFNINYIQNLKKVNKEENTKDSNQNNNQKIRAKKLKEKLKLKTQNNSKSFLQKAISDKNIEQNLDLKLEEAKEKENENQLICFYCRNIIELNSWEKPYVKVGLLINDYFYSNTIKATLRNELDNKNNRYKTKIIYDDYFWKNQECDIKGRIVSCGHYFHYDCIISMNNSYCILCAKKQNIFIPPLNLLKQKGEYNFLNGDNIEILEKNFVKENEIMTEDNINLFLFFIGIFLGKMQFLDLKPEMNIIDNFFEQYKSYFNFLENIFYSEGSTFNKRQQIDILQNIILSMRFFVKYGTIKKYECVNFIKENLSQLLKCSSEFNIIENLKNMYYVNLFEKIIFSLSILFDYEELKQTFKYLIYIFLPYFALGNYLRYLAINNIILDDKSIDNYKKYIIENNEEMFYIFELILKKFIFIKLITDYNNKNDEIINSFNELNIEQIISILNMDSLNKLLNKGNNNINLFNILEFIFKTFDSKDILFNEYRNSLNGLFELIIKNVKSNKKGNKTVNLTKELIINFTPLKFDFIKFDNKVFDLIEKNLEKTCDICSKRYKYYYICLICGKKICHTNKCNKCELHVKSCNGDDSILINMDDMRICYTIDLVFIQLIFPLYLNKDGIGPNNEEMKNEFYLSNENLKIALKKYVSYDFFFGINNY